MSKGIRLHMDHIWMPMPIFARLAIIAILVACALLLIRHVGIYMRRRHTGRAP